MSRGNPVRQRWFAKACATAGAAAIGGACLAVASFAEGPAQPPAAQDAPEEPLAALGRRLFHDPAASRTGRHSCASCHDPEHGWSDPLPFSTDESGPTRRHSQPLADLDFAAKAGFHWDGEFAAPADLAAARIADGDSFAVSGQRARQGGTTAGYSGGDPSASAFRPLPTADRLGLDTRYAAAFRTAFGDDRIDAARVAQAIGAFVGTLRTGRNALDAALAGDDRALPEPAARGLVLFRGKAGCANCHELGRAADGRTHLTDGLYHNTGVATAQTERISQAGTSADAAEAQLPERFRRRPGDTRFTFRFPRKAEDDGRQEISGAEEDKGGFKTPSLRDVARRGPYMHDGSMATLEEVVRYYAKGGTPNAHLDPKVRPFALSDGEVADLVAFLRSLDGAERPGLLSARPAEKRLRVTVVDLAGKPMPALRFSVVPAGERLGAVPDAAGAAVTTTPAGEATFAFPQSTHVVLRAAEFEIAGGTPIPDTAEDLVVTAAPLDRVTVLLRRPDIAVGPAAAPLPERLEGTVSTAFFVMRTADQLTEFGPPGLRKSDAKPETFVFERVRAIDERSALYSAPLGKERGQRLMKFAGEGDGFRAAFIDLSGGWSEPAAIRELVARNMGKR